MDGFGCPRGAGAALTTSLADIQGAYIAVFKRPLRPEVDLDGLFAVGGHGGATLSNFCEVDDPEIYLRFDVGNATRPIEECALQNRN